MILTLNLNSSSPLGRCTVPVLSDFPAKLSQQLADVAEPIWFPITTWTLYVITMRRAKIEKLR